jgi:hypothetical protein
MTNDLWLVIVGLSREIRLLQPRLLHDETASNAHPMLLPSGNLEFLF